MKEMFQIYIFNAHIAEILMQIVTYETIIRSTFHFMIHYPIRNALSVIDII